MQKSDGAGPNPSSGLPAEGVFFGLEWKLWFPRGIIFSGRGNGKIKALPPFSRIQLDLSSSTHPQLPHSCLHLHPSLPLQPLTRAGQGSRVRRQLLKPDNLSLVKWRGFMWLNIAQGEWGIRRERERKREKRERELSSQKRSETRRLKRHLDAGTWQGNLWNYYCC